MIFLEKIKTYIFKIPFTNYSISFPDFLKYQNEAFPSSTNIFKNFITLKKL